MVRKKHPKASCTSSHIISNVAEALTEPRHLVYNLSEVVLEELLRGSRELLVTHSLRHLRRVYPKATRVTSGNLVPLEHWRSGTCKYFSEKLV